MYYEFRLGSVLERGFSVFFKNFVPFMMLAVVIHLPILIFPFVADSFFDVGTSEELIVFGLILFAAALLLTNLLTATVMYGTFQQLRGQHAPIGACVAIGFRRFLPVVLVVTLSLILSFVGLVFFIIPGIILFCGFWVAVPVAVVERVGIMGALNRSWELTRGHRMSIFGLLFIVKVMESIADKVIETALPGGEIAIFGSLLVGVFFGALLAVINAVAYHDLRLAKDGIEAPELEAVFD